MRGRTPGWGTSSTSWRCTNWHGSQIMPHVIEGPLWGSILAQGMLREIVIVSDDGASSPSSGMCSAGVHGNDCYACWIHSPTRTAQQRVRADLPPLRSSQGVDDDPTARCRGELRARFEHIIRRRTGFVALDRLLVLLYANRLASLMVRDWPNGPQRDIRLCGTKREISGGARSRDGRDCCDAFLGLTRTAAKLGVAFWGFLGDQLSVLSQPDVQYLPDLLRRSGQPA